MDFLVRVPASSMSLSRERSQYTTSTPGSGRNSPHAHTLGIRWACHELWCIPSLCRLVRVMQVSVCSCGTAAGYLGTRVCLWKVAGGHLYATTARMDVRYVHWMSPTKTHVS